MEPSAARIEHALEAELANHPDCELLRATRYATLGGGRRLRGQLALLAGAIFRPESPMLALPVAVAIELIHTASLVLDDLPSMDNATTRRGKPCAHLVFPPWAVDMLPAFLVTCATQVIAHAETVSPECRVHALQLLGKCGNELAHGQETDLLFAQKKSAPTAAERLACYAQKSGALFAAALAGGGVWCGASTEEAVRLYCIGIKIGQAYQVLDDIADAPTPLASHHDTAHATATALLKTAIDSCQCWGVSAQPLRECIAQLETTFSEKV